jgi:hypothetical protein
LGEKVQQQETPIVGEAENKTLVRHDFEDEIFRIAGQISALAAEIHDVTLAAQVEFTLPQLDKLADDILEETGKRISGLATANLEELANYKITLADVTRLDDLTAQFHSVKTAPRLAIAGRSGQTTTLPPAVKGATSILRNRLEQMLMFKKTNPEFYAGYLSARVIVDRGGNGGSHPTPPTPPTTPA